MTANSREPIRSSFSDAVKRTVRPLTERPALLLFLLALAVRTIHLARSPHRDELFHVLGALSLLADGDLAIDGGVPYTRAWPFTYLLAGLFGVFGESLVLARLPGVVAGAGLVAAVFAWTRSTFGLTAAWTAGLLLCFDPTAVLLSQLGRFYPLHALSFFVGSVGLYRAFTLSERPQVLGNVLVASAGIGFALSLHIVSIIGIAGLLVWPVLFRGSTLARWILRVPGWVRWPALALVIAGVFLFVTSEYIGGLWSGYGRYDDWAESRSQNYVFYHEYLVGDYPTLWSLAPLLVVVALTASPRVAGFSTIVFAVGVGLASFGGMKHVRYIHFLMPFFFIVAGIAVGATIPRLRKTLVASLEIWSWMALRPRIAGAAASLTLVATLVFALGSNRAPLRTIRMLAVHQGPAGAYGWQADWKAARQTLVALADSSTVIVSSWPLAASYFLNRVDVSLHAPELTTRSGRLPEFAAPAWAMQLPTISEPESLARLAACSPSGLVIVEGPHWRIPWAVSEDVADFLLERFDQVDLPERWGLYVFRWSNAVDTNVSGAWKQDCGL